MNYSLAVLLGSLYSPFTGGDLQVELLSKSEKWSPWSEKSGAVLNFFCKFSKSFWKIKEMTDHKNKEISEIEMFKIKYVYKYTIFSLPITMPIYVYVCIQFYYHGSFNLSLPIPCLYTIDYLMLMKFLNAKQFFLYSIWHLVNNHFIISLFYL